MKKHHKLTLIVSTEGTRAQAELNVLVAFAKRDPDGCEFNIIKDEGANMIKDAKYQIEIPDGSKWQVPVSVIAENKAKYLQNRHEPLETVYSEFEKAPYEIKDWVSNNMDWDDVKEHAVCVKAGTVDFQEGWVNGHHEIIKEEE